MTFMTGQAEKPAHVPPEAVFEFDFHRDPALFVDPHKRALQLVQQAPPLFWTPFNGGHWMAISYDVAFQILRDYEIFSSSLLSPELVAGMVASGSDAGESGNAPSASLILTDPPEHSRLRAPLQRAFSPKTMMKLRDEIDALARELVEGVAEQGYCDFLTDVIEPLPVRIFLKMMGLPADRIHEYRALVREVFEPHNGDHSRMADTNRRIRQAMLPTILARREHRCDDLISTLWDVQPGEEMTLELMQEYCGLLFLAGLDTVINAMAHCIRHLASDQTLQTRLRNDPERIVEACEEMMRRYTITVPMRRARRDVELTGRTIRKGEIVVVYLSAADVDPAEFHDPAVVDIDRKNKNHLIFGAGPHRCVGSHLARIELQAFIRVVLNTLPEFWLDPEKQPVFHAGNMLAVASLPIRWK